MSTIDRIINDNRDIRRLTDAIYDAFVAPNPYGPFRRASYREYNQAVGALIQTNFLEHTPPPEVQFADAECQVPPVSCPSPLGNLHTPIQPTRCAANTGVTGIRGARCTFSPYTLCSVHFRYWLNYHRSPPGVLKDRATHIHWMCGHSI